MIIVIFGGAYDRRRRRKKILNRKRKEGDFSVAILQQSRSEFCRTKFFNSPITLRTIRFFFLYVSQHSMRGKKGITIPNHRPPSPLPHIQFKPLLGCACRICYTFEWNLPCRGRRNWTEEQSFHHFTASALWTERLIVPHPLVCAEKDC